MQWEATYAKHHSESGCARLWGSVGRLLACRLIGLVCQFARFRVYGPPVPR